MSLPENPLTRCETYLAKAAGQDVTLPKKDLTREEQYLRVIAEGGGGGGVTPEYVAEAIAEAKTDIEEEIPTKTSELTNDSGYATIDDTTAAQSKTYSSAKVEEKVAGEEIAATATSSPITDSADARVQGLTIYGRSEVVDGEIKSVGDDGLAVQTTGKNLLNSALFRQGEPNNPEYHANIRISSPPIPVKVGDIYTFSNNYTFDDLIIGIYVFDESFNILQKISEFLGAGTAKYKGVKTFTISAAGLLYIIPGKWINDNWGNVTVSEIQATNPQLELGSTATAYEPYCSTSAELTTALPLRSVSDEIYDTLDNTKVTKMCAEVDLGYLEWTYDESYNRFIALASNINIKRNQARTLQMICERYLVIDDSRDIQDIPDNSIYADMYPKIYVHDSLYSDAATFKAAVAGVKLIYPLETPTTTPLTDTEISAFRALRTFDSTTNIDINDEPEFTIDYLKNTDNGEAISRVVDLLQGADIKVFTYTGTGTVNHSTTFPEVPTMVLAMFGQHTFSSNTWSVSSRPFVWGVRPVFVDWCAVGGTSNGNQMMPATYNGREISFSGMAVSDPGAALNAEGETYTVYYI